MVFTKSDHYRKISTLHLIFAVVIHSLQNNTFIGTIVSHFGTYLCQLFMMRCYIEYLIWTIKKILLIGCIIDQSSFCRWPCRPTPVLWDWRQLCTIEVMRTSVSSGVLLLFLLVKKLLFLKYTNSYIFGQKWFLWRYPQQHKSLRAHLNLIQFRWSLLLLVDGRALFNLQHVNN